MSEPIDFNAERDKRHGPHAEFVRHDDYGRKMYAFLFEYIMDGADWGLEVWAYDAEDALNRMQAIQNCLTYKGQLFERHPA